VAQQIPERQDRPRDGATEQVEFLQIGGGSVAKDAKLVETLRARQAEKSADNENPTDVERKAKQDLIDVTKEQRAENLARRVYKQRGKQRKGDVPKSD